MLHLDCSVCKNENLLLLFNFGKKEVNKFMVLFFGIDRYDQMTFAVLEMKPQINTMGICKYVPVYNMANY